MNRNRGFLSSNRIGEPSSKYGYQPWKLDEDIKQTIDKHDSVKKELLLLLKDKYKCTPDQIKGYFLEILTEIGVL